MFTRSPAMKLAQKALASTAICGALALGTGGAAFASTSSASGSTPAATRHSHCARADKALARIDKVEASISQRLTKLEATESTLTNAGHAKSAARVEKRIQHLQNRNDKAGAMATKIQTRCPTATAS